MDRASATDAFQLDRDVGVLALLDPFGGRLAVQVGVVDGAGKNRLNDNIDLAYVARLVAMPLGPMPEGEGDPDWTPSPRFGVGGSAWYNLAPTDVRARTGNVNANQDVDGDGRMDNVSARQVAAELRAIWRGASLQGEWFFRRENAGVADPMHRLYGDYWGAYGQASYFILRNRLQLAVRAGRTELPLYGATLQQRLQAGRSSDEEAAAVGWYLHGHDVKLQADYTRLIDHRVSATLEDGTPVTYRRTTQRVRAQLQLAF